MKAKRFLAAAAAFALCLSSCGLTDCASDDDDDEDEDEEIVVSDTDDEETDSDGESGGRLKDMILGREDDEESSAADSSADSVAVREIVEDIEAADEVSGQLPDIELSNKTLKFLSYYDINPTSGEEERPELKLFRSVYGGSVEYVQTTYLDRFNTLSLKIMSDLSPDLYAIDDMDAFPIGAVKQVFQPIEDVVDTSGAYWDKTAAAREQFKSGGHDYLAITGLTPNYVCLYNRTTIEDNGYDDPAELYMNGEWTWDVFREMCIDFAATGGDNAGLDGYWFSAALTETTGKAMISFKNGAAVNNIDDPDIEMAQNMIYSMLDTPNAIFDRAANDWATRGMETGYGMGTYQTLFYPIGLWAIESRDTDVYGDMEGGEIMFVPMPKPDSTSEQYMSARLNGFALPVGSKNPEGFNAFVNCTAAADTTEFVNNSLESYGWNEDMIEMREICYELAYSAPVFNVADGCGDEISNYYMSLNTATSVTVGGMSWKDAKSEYGALLKPYIDELNSAL